MTSQLSLTIDRPAKKWTFKIWGPMTAYIRRRLSENYGDGQLRVLNTAPADHVISADGVKEQTLVPGKPLTYTVPTDHVSATINRRQ